MKMVRCLLAVVAMATALSADAAWADCCGAVNYDSCGSIASDAGSCCGCGSYTVMRTRRRIVWETKQIEGVRNVMKTVYDKKTINVSRLVRDVCYTTQEYTVRRPVRETTYKTVNYTVRRPVCETEVVNYTVRRPVWETHQKRSNLQRSSFGY